MTNQSDPSTPKEALKALAADLEELGVDVIDVVAEPEPQRLRVIAEADTTDERDEAIQGVMLAYQHAVHDFGDGDIAEVAVEFRAPGDDRSVTFTVDREWLPADRDDGEAWDEAVSKVGESMEVAE